MIYEVVIKKKQTRRIFSLGLLFFCELSDCRYLPDFSSIVLPVSSFNGFISSPQ